MIKFQILTLQALVRHGTDAMRESRVLDITQAVRRYSYTSIENIFGMMDPDIPLHTRS